MSDEFTTNENGSGTPEETNFQDYTAPENEIVQNETSQMTQEQPETSYGATSAEENPQPDNTAYAYGQTAYQQAYQSEQSQPNAYQQAYYGQTQAKGTGTGFGIASLVLGILSVFTFACCINYILAVLAALPDWEYEPYGYQNHKSDIPDAQEASAHHPHLQRLSYHFEIYPDLLQQNFLL